MNIAVGMNSLNSPEHLTRAVQCVMMQARPSDRVFVMQQGKKVADACLMLAAAYPEVTIIHPGYNAGCAAGWNTMIRAAFDQGYDAILVTGDDVFLPQGALDQVRMAVAALPDHMSYLSELGFSGFVMTRSVWDRVGEFDEGFWPAYYEDNDYWLRANRLGVQWNGIPCGGVEHVGSGSLKADREGYERLNADVLFPMNQKRYKRKWGGLPGHEKFALPWDGRVPQPGTMELAANTGYADVVEKVRSL